MKEKIKKVWKEHKVEIVMGTIIVGGIIYTITTKRHTVNCKGLRVITWDPGEKGAGLMTLEQIKRIIDLNVNNPAKFAIVREGLDAFACIKFDNTLII